MRYGYFLATALAVSTSVIAYEPAEERDFGEFAASGCRNRDGDFIVRGLVSSATEDTVVLSDPANSRTTTSVTLPGRGPFSRVRGAFGKNKQEASKEALDELRTKHELNARNAAIVAAREIERLEVEVQGKRGQVAAAEATP